MARFTVSLPADLLGQLDAVTAMKGYTNRSLAVADMIRDHLVEHRQQRGTAVIADQLIAAKGVKHGKLTVTSTGADLPA